jgi:hypothetical protein
MFWVRRLADGRGTCRYGATNEPSDVESGERLMRVLVNVTGHLALALAGLVGGWIAGVNIGDEIDPLFPSVEKLPFLTGSLCAIALAWLVPWAWRRATTVDQ